ncbi:tryptophan-rich sensory protein [Candidatus Micrarchaeota archaeon]|nr:tryptophan-rich sensory protein [Candidatus Micrarchaeota archaeon]
MKPKEIVKAIALIIICQLAGIIGSLFTLNAIPEWYVDLVRPDFAPPNWVFGPVWITLYTLMGISAYLILRKGLEKEEVRIALGVFGIQLFLNALWSILFFGLRSPFYAFIEIIILWFSILASAALFWRISKGAGLLLVPYILWVSFAAILNFYIWIMN